MLFRTRKEMQSLINASRKALKEAQDESEKLKYEKSIAENNNTLLLQQNKILKNIIKEIKLVSENNTYNNDKVALRKIKELASTANQN